MALKSLSLHMIFSHLVAASSLFGESAALGGRKALAPSPAAVGLPPIPAALDFSPLLDPKDPNVIEVANFAIDEYNKTHNPKLVLYSVLGAISTSNEQGINYGIIAAATNGEEELNDYHIDVFVSNNVKKLISFAPGQ